MTIIILSSFRMLAVSQANKNEAIYFPIKWENQSDVNDSWTKLERDNKGYLVYKPCDGSNPHIVIDSGITIVYWQLDGPNEFQIEKFTRMETKDGILFLGYNNNIQAEFTAEVVDCKRKLVLWKFTINWGQKERDTYKWVMTPSKFEKNFRLVDNPCPTEMKYEKQFLPIEFD